MSTVRRHPVQLAVLACCVSAGAIVLVGFAAGWSAVGDAFSGFEPGWLVLVAGGLAVAFGGYALAYRSAAATEGGPRLSWGTTVRLVLMGFAPQRALGGFRLDRDALRVVAEDEREAMNRVLVLGALEYAVLAPAACVSAIVLLVRGGGGVQSAVLWSWALAVPAGFAVAFSLEPRRQRFAEAGRVRRGLARALEPISLLRTLISASTCTPALAGMALYWAGEIVALGGALLCVGVTMAGSALIVAFATGLAATRRTLPLAGAGATDALLAYALHWCGVGLGVALAGVIVFRTLGFALPMWPALLARDRVLALVDDDFGADELTARAAS